MDYPIDKVIPTPALDRVQGPQDLHKMSLAELEQLASDIRAELVRTVHQTGGHLSSNLGTVELTIALHSMLDSPRDKIIFDVGHQGYPHKLLTGRRARFSTLRQYGGLGGFLDRDESEHDVWGAGHASTSLSAATGMAVARDVAGEDHQIVAVIGDGALTGGMALEALNNIGHLGRRLVVVLNDNGMSIAPNVGAINRTCNRFRLDLRYQRAKSEIGHVVQHLPMGREVWDAGRRIKRSMKAVLMPSRFFEELGFRYVGPVDGHNIAELRRALSVALDVRDRPVFVHAFTEKGHGWAPSEVDNVKYHGVAPPSSGSPGAASYSKVFGDTVAEIMRDDPKVTVVTAAMPDGTGLKGVLAEFPDRAFDVGICEQHAVTFCAGMATQGLKPIAAIYSTFLQRAYDQIIHDVCVQNVHVVLCMDRAGVVDADGKTHQGAFDLSYLSCLPNIVVAAPKDEDELRHLLYTGLQHDGPFALRYSRGSGLGVPLTPLRAIPIGSWELLREGDGIALVAVGAKVQSALEAADLLERRGIAACVVNARFVKPLDRTLLERVAGRCGAVLVAEENAPTGGLSTQVLHVLHELGLGHLPFAAVTLPDRFLEHGAQSILRRKYGLDGEGIAERAVRLLALRAGTSVGSTG